MSRSPPETPEDLLLLKVSIMPLQRYMTLFPRPSLIEQSYQSNTLGGTGKSVRRH